MDKRETKVGKKVQITEKPEKPNLKPQWIPPMDKYKGKIAKIVSISAFGYAKLDIDDGNFHWHPRWLTIVEE